MAKTQRILRADVDRMFTLIGEALEHPVAGGARMMHLLRGLAELTDAALSAFFVGRLCPRTGNVVILEMTFFHERGAQLTSAMNEYARYGSEHDPVATAGLLRPGIIACRRRELVPDRAWYKSEYFNEFPRRAGIDDAIHSKIRIDTSGREIGLGVHRDINHRPFTARETQIIDIMLRQLPWLAKQLMGGRQSIYWRKLTPRQQQIVRNLLTGMSRKQIAYSLGLSQHTINDHVKAIYQRLRISSRAELFALFGNGDAV